MKWLRSAALFVGLLAGPSTGGGATGGSIVDPLVFFEGATESVGTLTIVMHKPTLTRAAGVGAIGRDGSLTLVQRVEEQGGASHIRRWNVRQVGPGRFTAAMSEAKGPVDIEQVGGRYRFTFDMPGALSVEEWLVPLPGGRSATNDLTVRKFGIRVASFRGMVRKIG